MPCKTFPQAYKSLAGSENEKKMLREWELFGAVIAGAPASLRSDSTIMYTALLPSGSLSQQRSIRVSRRSPRLSGSSGGLLSCLTSAWQTPAQPQSNATVVVESIIVARSDASTDLSSFIPKFTISVPPGDPGSAALGVILSRIWTQSALMWAKPFVSAVTANSDGLENTLPLSTPMSRCFSVCLFMAAEMARPTHNVKHVVKSDTGGSAILTSAAFGGGASVVLNMDVKCESVDVKAKREGFRAVASSRPVPRNLELLRNNQGWRRRPSDPEPLKRGALEQTLFIMTQCIVDALEQRE